MSILGRSTNACILFSRVLSVCAQCTTGRLEHHILNSEQRTHIPTLRNIQQCGLDGTYADDRDYQWPSAVHW